MKKEEKRNLPNIISNQASMDRSIKQVCDILRRDKAKGARLYVPELTWMLFLSYLDKYEVEQELRHQAVGKEYTPILKSPYRWRDWAAPFDKHCSIDDLKRNESPGWKRAELVNGKLGSFLKFVND